MFMTPVSDKQHMKWGVLHRGEKKGAKCRGKRMGSRISVVSVKEKDIVIGNQLSQHDNSSQIGVVKRKG